MYIRSDERRPQLNTGLALRVAIMGGIGLVLFAVIFSASGSCRSSPATSTSPRRTTTAPVRSASRLPAGRCSTRAAGCWSTTAPHWPCRSTRKAPQHTGERAASWPASASSPSSLRKIRRTLREGIKVSGTAPVTLRQDVGHTLVYYLQRTAQSPGGRDRLRLLRRYPNRELAAHLAGSVGEIDSKELKEPRYRGLKPGDVIGKGGVEYSYDRYLRGLPGLIKNQVDSLGYRPRAGRSATRRRSPATT